VDLERADQPGLATRWGIYRQLSQTACEPKELAGLGRYWQVFRHSGWWPMHFHWLAAQRTYATDISPLNLAGDGATMKVPTFRNLLGAGRLRYGFGESLEDAVCCEPFSGQIPC
jgi:hypothetical protein